jgi:hypothetical protein
MFLILQGTYLVLLLATFPGHVFLVRLGHIKCVEGTIMQGRFWIGRMTCAVRLYWVSRVWFGDRGLC